MQQKIRELNQLLKQYLHNQKLQQDYEDQSVQTYSQISFTKPLKESRIRRIVPYNQNQLKIDLQKYVLNQWRQIFPFISQLRFQSLVFNQMVGIVNQIKCIRLVGLRSLDLSDCAIKSIQVFANMNLNVLKKLNLSNNAISSLKPLRKTNAFNLETLDLSNNCIVSLHALQQMKTKKNMSKLIIEEYGHWDSLGQEIQVLWKLQAKSIQRLKTESFQRVSKLNFSASKHQRFKCQNYE